VAVVAGCSGAPTIPLLTKPAPKQLTALDAAKNISGTVYFVQGARIWRLRKGNLAAVTPAGQRYAYPAVSAGGEVTAASYILNGESAIAYGGTDFSNLAPVSPLPKNPHDGSLDVKPAFSPDGSRLVFMSDRARGYADEAIWEGPVKGRVHQVSFPPDASGGDDAPAYVADGSAIVFTAWRDGHAGLDRAAIPLGRPKVVAKPTDHDIMDAVPGPGDQLAFTQRQGEAENIFVGALDGSAAKGVTSFNDSRQPAWSPDGKTLLFISPHAGTFDLYFVPVAGGNPVRLTAGADIDANSRPAWVAT
jgi:Tol biopolymer transport system component